MDMLQSENSFIKNWNDRRTASFTNGLSEIPNPALRGENDE